MCRPLWRCRIRSSRGTCGHCIGFAREPCDRPVQRSFRCSRYYKVCGQRQENSVLSGAMPLGVHRSIFWRRRSLPRLHRRVRCLHRSFLQTTAFLCSFYVRIAKPASFSSSTECRIFTPIFCLVPRVSQRVVRIISIMFCADLPSPVVQEMLLQSQIVSSKRRHPNMYTSSTNTGNSTRSNVGTSFGFRQCFRIWIRRRGDCCCRRSPRGDVRQDASLHNDLYWQMWFGSDSWVYSGLSRCIWLRGCLVPSHVQVGIVFLGWQHLLWFGEHCCEGILFLAI